MYTSDTEKKTARVYLWVSLFCALFGIVYECFSHGVFSACMAFAFLFPLLGGALPFWALRFAKKHPGSGCAAVYHCGIATLTTGSMVEGALAIYGTTNALTRVYWSVGSVLALLALLVYCFSHE